jgi:hypothetical protein
MAIDWDKVEEADREFHQSMVDSPIGHISEFLDEYGQPILVEVRDVHGLEVKFSFWEKKDDYLAMVMQVEDEIHENTHWERGETPEAIIKEYLEGFSIPVFKPNIQMGSLDLINIPCGLVVWAEGRSHLFGKVKKNLAGKTQILEDSFYQRGTNRGLR